MDQTSPLLRISLFHSGDVTLFFNRNEVYPYDLTRFRVQKAGSDDDFAVVLDSVVDTVSPYSELNVISALQTSLLKNVNAQNREIVPVKPMTSLPEPHTVVVDWGPAFDLVWDTYNQFWPKYLKVGSTYHLRLSQNGGTWFAKIGEQSFDRSSAQRKPNFITIHVRDPPPPLTASLSLSHPVCNLSDEFGSSSFTFIITITNHSSHPIIVEIGQHSLKDYGGLGTLFRLTDKTQNEKLPYWSEDDGSRYNTGELDIHPRPWAFEDILPGQPFVAKFSIDLNDAPGRTKLIDGHTYLVEVNERVLNIHHGAYGRKRELITGEFEELYEFREADDPDPPFWEEFDPVDGEIIMDWETSSVEFEEESTVKIKMKI